MLTDVENLSVSAVGGDFTANVMENDLELLRAYAEHGSEEAFKALLDRHVALVHSAALRQVGNPQLAEEITQAVFGVLARKAGSLDSKTILVGWLFRTTRFIAARTVRNEQRRKRREQEAGIMEAFQATPEAESPWNEISPHLDAALANLGEVDRHAILLRFFERKDLKEIGRVLGSKEDAVQKRVARALDKLRTFLIRRGATVSAAALAATLLENAVHAAPVTLSATTYAAATSGGGTAAVLINEAIKGMLLQKVQTAAIALTALLTTATAVTLFAQREDDTVIAKIVLGRFVSADGIKIVHQGGDGITRAAVFDGKECHELFPHPNNPVSTNPFMYFQLVATRKPVRKVSVAVEYCDVAPGNFRLDYDGPRGAFTASRDVVRLTGDMQWRTAVFILDDPKFQHRQAGEADFRIAASTRLLVRSVNVRMDSSSQ